MAKESKDQQKTYFETGDYPTQAQFGNLIDSCLGVLDSVSALPVASADNLGNEYKIGNVYYKCVLSAGVYSWQQTGTVVPSNDYTDIENKPKIGGVTLTQQTTVNDIGALAQDLTGSQQASSLDGSEIAYVYVNNVWKKSTVDAIRKPNTMTLTISSGAWSSVGDLYEATVSAQGITSSSIIISTPMADSIVQFQETPFWASTIGSGQITFQSSDSISVDLKVSIIYW